MKVVWFSYKNVLGGEEKFLGHSAVRTAYHGDGVTAGSRCLPLSLGAVPGLCDVGETLGLCGMMPFIGDCGTFGYVSCQLEEGQVKGR